MLYADVTVSGGSKTQRRLVCQAARYYLKKLLPRAHHGLILVVKLKKNFSERSGSKADCIWDDDRDTVKEFDIQIDSGMKIQAILRTLAHECVHIKQYSLREMRDTADLKITKWRGKKINTVRTNYWDHPWEIEAYGREIGLYEQFSSHFHYTQTRWYRSDPDY